MNPEQNNQAMQEFFEAQARSEQARSAVSETNLAAMQGRLEPSGKARVGKRLRGSREVPDTSIESPEPKGRPPEIDVVPKRPTLPPLRETSEMLETRQKLKALQSALEAKQFERARMEGRLDDCERQIHTLTGQRGRSAADIGWLNSKQLTDDFWLLFRKSRYGGDLGAQDAQNFAHYGTLLANRKTLVPQLEAELREIDERLQSLEKERAELQEKLGPEDGEFDSLS